MELSAVAAHTLNEGHQIHWEAIVVKRENTTKRKAHEFLTIKKLERKGKTINKESGLKLSKLWLD